MISILLVKGYTLTITTIKKHMGTINTKYCTGFLLAWQEDGISEEHMGDIKDTSHVLLIKLGGQCLAIRHRKAFRNYSLKYTHAL